MSKIKLQIPVVHTPNFERWRVDRSIVVKIVRELGFNLLYAGVHKRYWYTDIEGVSQLLPNLILGSDLYKDSIFTCINYAFSVWNEASSRFGLNTWVPVIGRIPNYTSRHAWTLILVGDEIGLLKGQFLFFEPNDGWDMGIELEAAGQAFPVGEEGYQGEMAFL